MIFGAIGGGRVRRSLGRSAEAAKIMREKPCRIISLSSVYNAVFVRYANRKGYNDEVVVVVVVVPLLSRCVCVCIPVGRCELVIRITTAAAAAAACDRTQGRPTPLLPSFPLCDCISLQS